MYETLTAAETGASPEATLSNFARAYVAFATENQGLWDALFEHSVAPGGTISDAYLAKIDRLFGLVETALAPLYRAADAKGRRTSALVLWSSLHGICSLALAGKLGLVAVQSVGEMADSLVTNYLSGLRAARDRVSS